MFRGFAHHCGRIKPATASVVSAFLFTSPCERPDARPWLSFCSDTPRLTRTPKHLIPRIDNVYKSWGGRGFTEKYEIEEEIGRGRFGIVYKARIKGTDNFRAVKKIDMKNLDLESMRGELNSLLNLDHAHIVKLIRYYEEGTDLYLIFELCTGPDLFDAVIASTESNHGSMKEYDVAVALRHILKALKCCHGHYMGHFDIKPENFVYRTPERTNLKMVDLGMSSGFALKSDQPKGTYDYRAPETYRGTYGPEADIWSCGVVFFVMLTGTPFFPPDITRDPAIMEQLANDRQWVVSRINWAVAQGISPGAHNLLKQMVMPDRHMRITVPEALKHPFIEQSYTNGLHNTEQKNDAMAVICGLQEQFRKFSEEPMLTRATLMLTAHLVSQNQEDTYPQRLAFRMLDRGGAGELSIDALEQALQSYNVSISGDLADSFKCIDTNGDGYISIMDFLSATLPSSVRNNSDNFRAAFRFLDRNRDGFIDVSDLINALGFETQGGKETCKEAMCEVCSAPYRVSFEQFLKIVQSTG